MKLRTRLNILLDWVSDHFDWDIEDYGNSEEDPVICDEFGNVCIENLEIEDSF